MVGENAIRSYNLKVLDTIVPLALGRQVYEAANHPKDFYLIRGANHNDTYLVGGEPYFQRLLSFLHQVQPSGQNS